MNTGQERSPTKSKKLFLVLLIFFTAGIISLACVTLLGQSQEPAACPPLPESFEENDLVGTWIGEYFDDTDKIIIRGDGTYKQIFSNDYMNFESEWQDWSLEYTTEGYALLHLKGMRRCTDLSSICNNSGGGLPSGEQVINPCKHEYLSYSDEVILFVTGYTKEVTKGIVLRQARFAGSDWNYAFFAHE